jgi:RNA polymerase sigma-70 factor (sigma-E family)
MDEADSEGFEAFVAARTGALLRYAYVLTGDRHRAEDLVQSALASSYRHWRRVAPDGAERYVRKAVLNAYLSWWRRPARVRETSVDDVALLSDARGGLVGADAGVDTRDEMWRALGTLPPRQRAVVVLRYFEDLTEVETAERMNITVGTVKSQHAKALRALQAVLGPEVESQTELAEGAP